MHDNSASLQQRNNLSFQQHVAESSSRAQSVSKGLTDGPQSTDWVDVGRDRLLIARECVWVWLRHLGAYHLDVGSNAHARQHLKSKASR